MRRGRRGEVVRGTAGSGGEDSGEGRGEEVGEREEEAMLMFC